MMAGFLAASIFSWSQAALFRNRGPGSRCPVRLMYSASSCDKEGDRGCSCMAGAGIVWAVTLRSYVLCPLKDSTAMLCLLKEPHAVCYAH
eukprot:SAG22_NODE_1803_length_3533_cov_25.281013_4_plen_90_part_00